MSTIANPQEHDLKVRMTELPDKSDGVYFIWFACEDHAFAFLDGFHSEMSGGQVDEYPDDDDMGHFSSEECSLYGIRWAVAVREMAGMRFIADFNMYDKSVIVALKPTTRIDHRLGYKIVEE